MIDRHSASALVHAVASFSSAATCAAVITSSWNVEEEFLAAAALAAALPVKSMPPRLTVLPPPERVPVVSMRSPPRVTTRCMGLLPSYAKPTAVSRSLVTRVFRSAK